MTTYEDEESEGQRALARALSLIEDRDQLAADIAAREEWLQTHHVPDRQPPEPELPARTTPTTRKARLSGDELRNLTTWISARIRTEVAAALKRREVDLADAIGKAIARERQQWRTINDALISRIVALETERRTESDSNAVLDLNDERRRRSA